ncbi:MAG: glycoside hydrolase, partial [Clostridium saccharoperbutylacetonicum]
WQEVNGEWYYLDHTGVMQTGWIHDDGKDYLMYSNGMMAHDCDYIRYNFNEHGVSTKLS